MNKQDFKLIASALSQSRPSPRNLSQESHYSELLQWKHTTETMCNFLYSQFNDFDKEKFYQATNFNGES